MPRAKKRKIGRPRTVMTDEAKDKIVRAVRLGLWPDRAAEMHGIKSGTMRKERKIDPAFSTAIKEAEAAAESAVLSRILRHMEKQWTAAAWMLERRWPERWAKREVQPPPNRDDARKLLDDIRAIKALEESVTHATPTNQAPAPQGGEASS